jgi:hypothetical protein
MAKPTYAQLVELLGQTPQAATATAAAAAIPATAGMSNMDISEKSGILTITINLNGVTTPSSTGKSKIVASTRGTLKLPSGWKMGLNIFK